MNGLTQLQKTIRTIALLQENRNVAKKKLVMLFAALFRLRAVWAVNLGKL